MSEVYARHVDTAGNYHYTDMEIGHYMIRKSYGYCHEDSDGYGGRIYRKFVQDEVLDNGIIKGHMELIKTNADRIRNMTDEEIADFLCDIGECDRRCSAKIGDCIFSDSTCRIAWLEWLKEEMD